MVSAYLLRSILNKLRRRYDENNFHCGIRYFSALIHCQNLARRGFGRVRESETPGIEVKYEIKGEARRNCKINRLNGFGSVFLIY